MKFFEISEIEQEEGLFKKFKYYYFLNRMIKYKEAFILKKGGGRYK